MPIPWTHCVSYLLFLCLLAPIANANADGADYDADAALETSQAAIGGRLGNYSFTDIDGRQVRLTDFAGKPLVVSLIFTSCYHICPVTTRRLDKAVIAAHDALGEDSFQVVTIGFDSARDTPDNMREFARQQRVLKDGWTFLSASAQSSAQLRDDLGFVSYASPRGFDHIMQVSIIDRDSVVDTQVYGETFELPWLVEPLKDLVFNRPRSEGHVVASLFDRLRIFCTVYDPAGDRYRIDYSLFIQMAVGFLVVLSVSTYLVREALRARRNRSA